MTKKGVELSVNVIIIAVIALIVLVLLAFLVLRSCCSISKGNFCENTGGTCKDVCDSTYESQDLLNVCSKDLVDQGLDKCCKSIPV
ncbi:hypothetical protein C4573_01245 [Candidatus Woesearchaeota archaeon]|nr:MAG: hypothetical protein C4573_01245 [Candidatus Woesearchaeota archaeon]